MTDFNDFEIVEGELISYSGESADIVIPDTVKKINSICSRGNINTKLENIYIPESVSYISPSAFASCENLLNINIDEDNKNYSSYYGVLFDKLEKILLTVPAGRKGVFKIRDGVIKINPRAFYKCSKITEIILPEGMFTIGAGSFDSCKKLSAINIPGSVNNISDSAFINCTSLINIEVDKKNPDFLSSEGCLFKKTSVEFDMQGQICGDFFKDFIVKELFIVPEGKSGEIVIEEGVIRIGNNSFRNCKKVKSVVITYGVITIGKFAFDNCINLQTVSISEGVKVIESNSFSNCKKLKYITIPETVNFIDKDSFSRCPEVNFICKPGSYGESFARENNISCKTF